MDKLGLTSSENTFGEFPFLTEIIDWFQDFRNSTMESFWGQYIFSLTENFVLDFGGKMTPKEARAQISKGGGQRSV